MDEQEAEQLQAIETLYRAAQHFCRAWEEEPLEIEAMASSNVLAAAQEVGKAVHGLGIGRHSRDS